MELSEALVEIPQRERGGEIAQRGLDFQTCWALSHLFEYELEGKQYVFILEYHDDVLILDSETKPEKIVFAQVKTNENSWTIGKLINASEKKPISFIAKLYQHKQDFENFDTELLFISNATFSFHNKNKFLASELPKETGNKISLKINEQISYPNPPLPDLTLIKTDLSLEKHFEHLLGKLCVFFEKNFNGHVEINIPAFAKTLESDCRQKSKISSSEIRTFDELISKKGISSQFIKSRINEIIDRKKLLPNWDMAKELFMLLKKSSIKLITLQSVFSRITMSIEIKDQIIGQYYKEANSIISIENIESDITHNFQEIINELESKCGEYADALTPDQKECITIYCIIKKLLVSDAA